MSALSKKNNLRLWDDEQNTPADKTKKVNRRGGFTSVNQQYQLYRATRQWGPYGTEWGMRITRHEVIELGDTSQRTIVLEVVFWYPDGEFDYIVDWPYKEGDDSYKKAITSARSKCMSLLGFSSDVYSGFHDSPEYLKEERFRDNPSELDMTIASMKKATDVDRILKCLTWSKRAKEQGTINESQWKQLVDVCNARKQELKKLKNTAG